MTHRLDVIDVDVFLAHLQDFLSGAVALDLRRRGVHAQVLAGQLEALTVVEGDLEDT
jgi:hypothetical protein